MSRIAVALSCEAEVMNELIRMSKSRSEEVRMVERSRIILGCLAGKRNDMVAAELGVRPGTVGTWRKRFADAGLAGLSDRPRPGKPPIYPPALKQRRSLARIAQGRYSTAAPSFVVREYRPTVCGQGRRHHWAVSESAAERLGHLRRRKALDSGIGTQDRLRSNQQRQDRAGVEEHL